MVQRSYPFDAGDGAAITEDQWSLMAQQWLPSGPIRGELNELRCFADSSGMQVKINTGRAFVRGHFYENDAIVTLPIAANASGAARRDLVVLRLDKVANTIVLAVILGVAAAADPIWTQSSAIFEVPIAHVTVPNGAATIAAGDVVDRRMDVAPTTGEIYYQERTTNVSNYSAETDILTTGWVYLPYARRLRLTAHMYTASSVGSDTVVHRIYDDVTLLQVWVGPGSFISSEFSISKNFVAAPAWHRFRLAGARNTGTGLITAYADPTFPIFLQVEDMGPINVN